MSIRYNWVMSQVHATILPLRQVGDPILRGKMRRLDADEICSSEMQQLIADIKHTVAKKQYGVGLAAPQVGRPIALSVIAIKPTPNRPDLEPFERMIINPKYKGIGKTVGMWEGCASGIDGQIFAQAQRYKKITAEWDDESGKHHSAELSGFVAHVFQHETDHLNGILFFERVTDPTTYMMAEEYRKRVAAKNSNS